MTENTPETKVYREVIEQAEIEIGGRTYTLSIPTEKDWEAWDIKGQDISTSDWRNLGVLQPPLFYNKQRESELSVVVQFPTKTPEQMLIRSHLPIEKYGGGNNTIRRIIKKPDGQEKIITLPTMLDPNLHGYPCETRSVKHGGGRYPRIQLK